MGRVFMIARNRRGRPDRETEKQTDIRKNIETDEQTHKLDWTSLGSSGHSVGTNKLLCSKMVSLNGSELSTYDKTNDKWEN